MVSIQHFAVELNKCSVYGFCGYGEILSSIPRSDYILLFFISAEPSTVPGTWEALQKIQIKR